MLETVLVLAWCYFAIAMIGLLLFRGAHMARRVRALGPVLRDRLSERRRPQGRATLELEHEQPIPARSMRPPDSPDLPVREPRATAVSPAPAPDEPRDRAPTGRAVAAVMVAVVGLVALRRLTRGARP